METFSKLPRSSAQTKHLLSEGDIERIDALLVLRLTEHLCKITDLIVSRVPRQG